MAGRMKERKKILRLVAILLALVLTVMIVPPFRLKADTIRTGKVWNYSSLKVRTGAGTSYPQCGLLVKGAYVIIDGEEKTSAGKTWYHVRYENISGYVNGDYIEFCDVPVYTEDMEFEKKLQDQGFPESYKEYLRRIHAQYPSWDFISVKSVLSWQDALDEQLSEEGDALIYGDNPSSWKSTKGNAYDWETSTWRTGWDSGNLVIASEEITAYYMDPRNFFTTEGLFMFLDQKFDESQTVEGVKSVAKDTFLEGNSKNDDGTWKYDPGLYVDSDGSKVDYPQAVYNAGKNNGVNPYVLVSMMIQELGANPGKNGTVKSIVAGEYTGAYDGFVYRKIKTREVPSETEGEPPVLEPVYTEDGVPVIEGFFNYYNIGAYANGGRTAIERGLWYAKGADKGNTSYKRPWDSRVKALDGGANFLYSSYLSQKQSTFYLKKWNILSPTCAHQWMTNVDGCYGESIKMSNAYSEDIRKQSLTFLIPVFDDMPETPCPMPFKDGSPNNKLSTISVEGYTLTPTFSRDILDYDLVLPHEVTQISLNALAYDSTATVNGIGEFALAVGTTQFPVEVMAENGDVRTYTVTVARESKDTDSTEIQTSLTVSENYIGGIGQSTTCKQVYDQVEVYSGTLQILNANKETKAEEGIVGTGDILVVSDDEGNVVRQYSLYVKGDTGGDGEIKTGDMIKIRNHILGSQPLSGVYIVAADINGDGEVKTGDMIKVRNYIVDAVPIVP